jgi:hypothetical protein
VRGQQQYSNSRNSNLLTSDKVVGNLTPEAMWLIDTETLKLKFFAGPPTAPYAILSHTWAKDNDDEVSFQEIHRLEGKHATESERIAENKFRYLLHRQKE